jgi:hypothetical protein
MGYDLSSVNNDPKVAEDFAKKFGYTYLFDKETGAYQGGPDVYFRANIWGMAAIRGFILWLVARYENGVDEPSYNAPQFTMVEKMSFNDGEHVTKEEIIDLFLLCSANSNFEVDMNLGKPTEQDTFNQVIAKVQPLVFEYSKVRTEQLSVNENGQPVVSPDHEENVNGLAGLINEFLEYNKYCYELDGFRVY